MAAGQTSQGQRKLAIIAGRDDLPRLIAEDRAARDMPYLVISFGDTAGWMAAHPHKACRFEKVGQFFALLRGEGVQDVVFAGAMDRPRLKIWQADWKAAMVAGRVLTLLRKGDDGLLRGLAQIFEEEGFRILGAEDCLPALIHAEAGALGRHGLDEQGWADARRAARILAALGPLDVAQSVAVSCGICLGIEAIEGTDALLARIAALPEGKRGPTPAGVLVKLPKPGQDRRVDLPTIGPKTVTAAAEAGLTGILFEASGTHLIDRARTVAKADAAGLALWALAPEEVAAWAAD